MKTLVYGAGPLGSYCAAKLHEAGVDVSLLAEGQRLEELRKYGVVVEYVSSGNRVTYHVPVVEELGEHDPYDLILVMVPRYIMTKEDAKKLLPRLAVNKKAHTVLFLNFNISGFDIFTKALGAERVMAGYLVSTAVERDPHGGAERDQAILVMPNSKLKSPIGEVDGSVTERTRQVAALLRRMSGQPIEIRCDIDAWLVGHVLSTLTYLGLFAADIDAERYRRTRGALQLGIRARTEAIRAQLAAGIPISPPVFRILPWFPEPVAIAMLRAISRTQFFEIGVTGICKVARREFASLLEEYRDRLGPCGVDMPAFELMNDYIKGKVQPLPDGSREMWQDMVHAACR